MDSAGNLFYNDRQKRHQRRECRHGKAPPYPSLGVVPGTAGGGSSALAIDGNGNMYTYGAGANSSVGTVVYVAMLVNGSILPRESASSWARILRARDALQWTALGNIYVADTAYNRIVKETYLGGTYSQSVLFSGPGCPHVRCGGWQRKHLHLRHEQ